jgi:hypothetical protein
MLDFNRKHLAAEAISITINELIERTATCEEEPRLYLGASIVGGECARKVQYNWMVQPEFPARTLSIFDRGHFFEAQSREYLKRAGFQFHPSAAALAFTAVDGLFRGHADGVITAGPAPIEYPALWEHKALGAKGWRKLERDGLLQAYPEYAAHVAIYQSYLDVTNPALFTALNADTCERLHILVPFDAVRAQAWSDRAVVVIEATRAGQLLPRLTDDRTDWRCRMCSHHERCWGI